jgi:hypothetical protein
MSENVSENASVKKFDFKKFGIIAGLFVLVLAVVYVGFALYFRSHFFFRSTLNGVNSSGVTVDDVMKKIDAKAKNYSLTIKGENATDVIHQSDIDMQVADSKKEFEKALSNQNEWAWPVSVFKATNYKIGNVVNYDKDKLKSIISGSKNVKNDKIVETKDAFVQYNEGKFIIQKEVYGTNVDMDKFLSVIDTSIMTLDKSIDMKEQKCYVQPKLTADSDSLKKACEELNKKINISFQIL